MDNDAMSNSLQRCCDISMKWVCALPLQKSRSDLCVISLVEMQHKQQQQQQQQPRQQQQLSMPL
jgi:hypothetical protein